MKSRLMLIAFIFTAITSLNVAYAQEQGITIPSFPRCLAPQGTQKVFYPTGIHGIPGNTGTYTGSDTVYILSEETLMQCFCPTNGAGIQSNWWNVSNLSLNQIDEMVGLGWIFVPNGTAWGLQEAPYLVKNEAYQCKEDDNDDDDDNGDNDDDDDNDDDLRIGGIGGPFGQVLGLSTLANTGNLGDIALYFGLSSGLFTIGALKLKKSQKDED